MCLAARAFAYVYAAHAAAIMCLHSNEQEWAMMMQRGCRRMTLSSEDETFQETKARIPNLLNNQKALMAKKARNKLASYKSYKQQMTHTNSERRGAKKRPRLRRTSKRALLW
jgi:hypothetical protein